MRFVPLCVAVGLVAFLGSVRAADDKLPAEVQKILDKAEEIELLSLDPSIQTEKPKDGFHGWPVLGKTTVTKDGKKAVLEAVGKGVKESNGDAAKCFNPRHGIKATHDGKTVELVICFECLQVQAYTGDAKGVTVTTTAAPQKTLDAVLADAKVPLPGGAKK